MGPGNKGNLDEKQRADERFNPSDTARDLYRQEHDSIDGYDRQNDGLDDHPVSGGDASGVSGDKGDNPSKNIDDARNGEESGSWRNKVTGRGTFGNKPFERGERLTPANIQALVKRKGPLGLLITILLGGTFTIGGMFTGLLAPFAFMENVTDDLNDQLAAMDVRSEAMLRTKIPRAEVKESIAGCTKLSIRCKFKTMSRKQVLKYERAGIIATGTSTGVLGTRISPDKFTFRGEEMTAQEFTNKLKTDPQLRVAYKRALNMKFLGLNDNSFVNRTLKRFGISKRPPELKGTHRERVDALMNKAGTKKPADLQFVEVRNDKGEIIRDKWNLVGDTASTKTVYTTAQKDRMMTSIARASAPPSRLSGNVMKTLSVLGYWDLACTIKNMIGGASVAAKLANQYELAQYAMPILSIVSKAKAGDNLSVEDGQVIGEFFGATDAREKIVDLENSVTTDEKTKQVTPNAEAAMKDNPNYGKNAMDSPLYKLSSMGTYNATTSVETQYSLGMGQRALLAGFAGFADILQTLGELGNNCKFVQNWAVRGIGVIVGVVAAIFSGGSTLAVNGLISGGMIAASMILEAMINNALSGSILAGNMHEAPLDRAAALWSGTASVLSESAKNRGMMPGNTEQIMAYNTLQIESKNDYIAVERETANPLDINNQYSFLGSLGRSMLPYFTAVDNPRTAFGSVLSFTTNSISKAVVPLSTYAATIDPTRFSKCDDEGYKNTDKGVVIDADVQCNIRYVMPPEDLKLDTDTVAKYMEDNDYVEDDTTTGLPIGYTPPVPAESQGFALDMLNSTVNTFYNTRNYGEGPGKTYGKFLDFCAYRIMPFGETFEENGQINGVEDEWVSGKKCLDTTDPMMSYFRIYTLDKSVSEAEDEDVIEVPTGAPTVTETAPVGSNSSNVNAGGWTFPTTAGATLVSPFGPRGGGYHTGIDLNVPTGSPFYAAKDGVVEIREYSVYSIAGGLWCPVLGSMTDPVQKDIWLTHNVGGTTYTSVYAHMSKFLKKNGDVVKAGDLIGYTGGSGCSSGPHVHFEIWEGRANPSVPGPGMRDPWPLINP